MKRGSPFGFIPNIVKSARTASANGRNYLRLISDLADGLPVPATDSMSAG
ncbi:MAG: hypothetical protein Q8Q90_00985 [bacterium]|nr:hypothetical protein [bacterium]